MTNFNFEKALEAAKQVKVRNATCKYFDTEIVLEIIGKLGQATPSQIATAYNAGMETDVDTKKFSDWLWNQRKKGVLVVENHAYSLAVLESSEEPKQVKEDKRINA